VRDAPDGIEVLLVRRDRKAVFLGGARVFPGGRVDPADHSDLARRVVRWSGPGEELPWRAAALRELFEEAGVLLGSGAGVDPALLGEDLYRALEARGGHLDADRLQYFANWITPLGPPRRFDTRFYLVTGSVQTSTDDREVFDAVWVAPSVALDRFRREEWFLEVPTRSTVAWLAPFASAAEAERAAAAAEVHPIAPRVVTTSEGAIRVLLPGEPGYEQAPA
jgi:8-oxo-dGTP pyrophosphatase MutT (NUDIX family)